MDGNVMYSKGWGAIFNNNFNISMIPPKFNLKLFIDHLYVQYCKASTYPNKFIMSMPLLSLRVSTVAAIAYTSSPLQE